jgi:DNA transformation protein
MGIKGEKRQKASTEQKQLLADKLVQIEGITTKKMFGGHGVFHENKMFGLIDSKGVVFFKTNEITVDDYLDKSSDKHSRMPYYSVPTEIFQDFDKLEEWAKKSIVISK